MLAIKRQIPRAANRGDDPTRNDHQSRMQQGERIGLQAAYRRWALPILASHRRSQSIQQSL